MAPPFNAMNFGCEEKFDSAERIQQFPLELYHAMNAVKRRDGNAEFDPESLADGLIYDDTYESEFLDDISKDLHPAFVMCLQHLEKLKTWNIANQKWEAGSCAQRTEAEFEDNTRLHNMLLQGNPGAVVPFGRDPMIAEYWMRRCHDFESMKAEYLQKQRADAQIQEAKPNTWLDDDGEEDINFEKYAVAFGWWPALNKPLDYEIQELQQYLPVEMVGNHLMDMDIQVFTRAYEAWEPEVLWGEETFPYCAEGEEAYFALKNYRDYNLPPAALKAHFEEVARQKCVVQEEQAVSQQEAAVSPRKDSMSPGGDLSWCLRGLQAWCPLLLGRSSLVGVSNASRMCKGIS
jgi:hypothetical protein